ncbi:putative ZDHHC-type palmitoyltransferase 6 [Poecilia reticulata]|uniref:putative ZDHHC-type palmitoyltransferase 6 n=1 Tax=Poecilia reticulata TaxID=8081 RepID=UPI0004A4004E|nr:PREDICTED: putative ZDHHC-type palmitoyltransferase 6 [Poecilia reticulata]
MEIVEDRFCAPITMHAMPLCTISGGDIFDCIQRGDVEQCILFVQNDRTILRHTGWGGFSPLHYAALHGNRSLVDFFLSSGADPNMTCDSGQTAFHFACRQGNIYNMHKMMQYGADLRLVDLQGKTSMHHAVTGGNIVAVHYLWETGVFRLSDADMYKVTPLHLAASTGNIDMIRYLLKDQRCVVNAVDQRGATALHVAAERGGVEVCWALLQKTGCIVLHQKNYSGLTPLDLCKQGKTFRHQQLSKLLKQYINEPIHHKPRESDVLYYWTLFFPSLSGAAILLIAAMFGGYGGLICAFLFPWLARSIFTQYYRMTTYQRLANPIYLGTLLAGIVHSLLCFYGKMMPSVWPISTLAQVSLLHFFILASLFYKVLTQDPGVLDRADADPRFSCIADLVENNESPHRFCPYCELFQPDYTKHCKLCEVCIKDYDHHCLFLNCCIGQGNHRLFLIFILSMVTAHLLFIASGASYLYFSSSESSPSFSLWLTLLGEEFWVVALIIMNALTLLWEVWLLTEQFDAIAARTTTYFRHSEGTAQQRSLGQRLAVVAAFLLEGRRSVGGGQITEDKTAIDI